MQRKLTPCNTQRPLCKTRAREDIWRLRQSAHQLLYTTVSKPEFGIVGLLGWCNPASEALQVIGTSRVCGIQSYPCIAGRRIKTVATKIYRVFSYRWTFPHSIKVVSSSGGYLEGAQLYYLGNSVRPRHKVGLIAQHPLHHCATHPSLHICSYFSVNCCEFNMNYVTKVCAGAKCVWQGVTLHQMWCSSYLSVTMMSESV